MSQPEKFWTEDISVLVNNIRLLPTKDMSREEKSNVLMRLVIIASIVLYFVKWEWWLHFLFASTIIIIFLNYNEVGCAKNIREGFTVVPTFGPGDPAIAQTFISPSFAEEWIVNPALNAETTILNGSGNDLPSSTLLLDNEVRPYPYGQYLTSTNLMPSTEAQLASISQQGKGGLLNRNGGAISAKEYANSEFTRASLAFRENMQTTYRNMMNRRYGTHDGEGYKGYTISPYRAY